ncbi:MAG: hypothetical protein ACRD3O_21010, partial [Terriglobia bacterium]
SYDEPPNQLMRQRMDQLFGKADATLKQFNALLSTRIAAYNKAARAAGAPSVFAGSAITVEPPPAV